MFKKLLVLTLILGVCSATFAADIRDGATSSGLLGSVRSRALRSAPVCVKFTTGVTGFNYVPNVGFRLTLNTTNSFAAHVPFLRVEASYDRGATFEILSDSIPIVGNSTVFVDDGSWNGKDPLEQVTMIYRVVVTQCT